jgi:hypothetical protein
MAAAPILWDSAGYKGKYKRRKEDEKQRFIVCKLSGCRRVDRVTSIE